MVKSVLSVLLLCLLVGLFTPLNQVDDNAVITLNGKSSGEFIYKKYITVSDFYDVNGLSLTLSRFLHSLKSPARELLSNELLLKSIEIRPVSLNT